MSKAILILDEMPCVCGYCIGYLHYLPNTSYCLAKNRFFPNDVDSKENRPDWCPLRPMPDKQQLPTNTVSYDSGFAHGWNACIDVIEGNEGLEGC